MNDIASCLGTVKFTGDPLESSGGPLRTRGFLERLGAMIRKLKSGEYRLYSRKKGSDGKRRNLGTFSSRAGAEKHEREVQGFKHRG
jgi:hypothetical protein